LDSFDDATYTAQTRPFAFHSIYDDRAAGGSVELDERLLDGRDQFRAAFHVRWDQHNAQQRANAAVPVPGKPPVFVWYEQPWVVDEETTYSISDENTYHPDAAWDLIVGVGYDIRHMIGAQDFDSFTPTPAKPPFGFVVNYPLGDKYALNPQAAAIYHFG